MWGRAANVHLSRIFLLQKKILRCIFNVVYREHTASLFMESKIMTIYQLNYYMVCIFMYKYHHSQLPAIFDNMFITNENIYTYSTRQRIMYQVPRCRLESKRITHYALLVSGILIPYYLHQILTSYIVVVSVFIKGL